MYVISGGKAECACCLFRRVHFFDLTEMNTQIDKALQQLKNDGFGVIPNFLTGDEVNELKDEMCKIVDEMDPAKHPLTIFTANEERGTPRDKYFLESANKIGFFYEDKAVDESGKLLVDKNMSLNKVGHALHHLNPVFQKVSFSSKMKDIVKKMGFVDPAIVQSMYIFKNPRIGGVVTPHIDATFLYVDPIDHLAGFWFPLDDATQENGCLYFIPGSHKASQVSRRFVRSDKSSGSLLEFQGESTETKDSDFIPVPVKKGSLVLIDGLVIHKSAANTSANPRHAYTFHAVDLHNTVWSHKNWLQKEESMEWPRLK